ncbi:hypothetical protein [Clostridium lundense]|uniref:hypothetical protein n=1 Tax=Clostridium lundense TaxID=319475 RepID=UPI0006871A29|nr:hypothetical protein [Clostridium lundense]
MSYEKLKWQDEVKDQNGVVIQVGTPLSARNMNNLEDGVDLAVNLEGALIAELFNKVGSVTKELEKWQKQRLQQGVVTIYNKAVKSGCVINAMVNSRYVQISKTGTFLDGNISEIYVDGITAGVKDEQMIAMVPQNSSGSSATYYIYIDYNVAEKRYKPMIAATVPDGKMSLYRITVPANDNNMDLAAVTITDIRRIESNPVIRSTEPYALVSIPGYPEIDLDYDVHLTVESASNIGAVGDLILYGKTANGFYIKYTGSADNVVIRWTLVNPDIK